MTAFYMHVDAQSDKMKQPQNEQMALFPKKLGTLLPKLNWIYNQFTQFSKEKTLESETLRNN